MGVKVRNGCPHPSISTQPLPGLHLAPLTPLSERGGTPPPPLTFPEPSSALPCLRRSPPHLSLSTRSPCTLLRCAWPPLCERPTSMQPRHSRTPLCWPHCVRGVRVNLVLKGNRGPQPSCVVMKGGRLGGAGHVNREGGGGGTRRSLAPLGQEEGVGRSPSWVKGSCAV